MADDHALTPILNRELRTVRVLERPRAPDPRESCRAPSVHSDSCSSADPCTRRRRTRTHYYPKFGEVFVWICLFNLANFADAAPRRQNRSMDSLFQRDPAWINPCGNGPVEANSAPAPDESRMSDQDLFLSIEQQTKIALDEAEVVKKDYVQSMFNNDFDDHHSEWRGVQYSWLPDKKAIPKNMGEPVPQQHLMTLKADVNLALANMFKDLQRLAVGLEQVDHDQQRFNGRFKQLFNNAKNTLTAVLCEIQIAMTERGTQPHPHITRDIMDDKLRTLTEESDRNIRDWIIYREYINAMEYLYESIKFIKQ